jgi:anti-sigma regulatory factor (Ser/Thr protein kinase)
MNPSETELLIQFRSDPDLLPAIRGMLRGLCERQGFNEEEIGHITLAVDEALANIIRHGYQNRSDGPIWISCGFTNASENRLIIEIEDECPQVSPQTMTGRDLKDIRPGGLGVHLMREVMDLCEFQARPNVGMRVRLEKISENFSPKTLQSKSNAGSS